MPEEIKIESDAANQNLPVAVSAKAKQSNFNWRNFLSYKKQPAGSINLFKLAKYIYPLTIISIILVLFWVLSFLYNYVYLTMTQAEIVNGLKSKVVEKNVDYEKFNSITEKINWKNNLADWPYLNILTNPFVYGTRATYPVATVTTTVDSFSTTTKATSTKI